MLFDPPPMAAGTDAQQLSSLYSYLYQMSEKLNTALSTLTSENFAPGEAAVIQQIAAGKPTKAQTEEINSLKSLIIKTADIVRSEMDVLETQLRSEYVAQSEFGTYQESMDSKIMAKADEVVQSYGYDAAIAGVQSGLGTVESFRVNVNAYIKTGLLYYEEDGITPVYGVAVGEKLAKVTINGEEVLSRTGMMSTFTAGRLSFWQGTTEIAYMTGGVLHIPRAELSDQLVVGNYVIKRLQDGGFGIMMNRQEG